MKLFLPCCVLLIGAIGLSGCLTAPGKPAPGSEAQRPDQVLDFATLYKQNCSACHGENGRNGAAIALANPAYLAYAGAANLTRITANGVPGTMMPPFSRQSGGTLTDQQIQVLIQGMLNTWGKPAPQPGTSPLPYASTLTGDPAKGAVAFAATCARCHGAPAAASTGSLVDPAYLALISDQGLRSFIVAGHSDAPIPALADQDVTNIVAWLGAHRTQTPGQPYPQHP